MAQKNLTASYKYRVKGLFIPEETPCLDQGFGKYIDSIEQYTEDLEECFDCKDTAGFMKVLETILDMLRALYAHRCVSYAAALVDAAKKRGLDDCRQLIKQTIADFLLLSIEMQKAQKLEILPRFEYGSIEKTEDNAQNLAAISRLISIGDYERAESMAYCLTDTADTFVELTQLFKAHQYHKAKELADTMETKYIEIIRTVNTSKSDTAVLAVDDRPEILANVSAALRGHYKVFGAPNGKIALDIIKLKQIGLFFVDINMPVMDGFELTRQIRADSVYNNTPIILLTATASKANVSRGIELGVNDFIIKPSDHLRLLAKARMYIDEVQQREGKQ